MLINNVFSTHIVTSNDRFSKKLNCICKSAVLFEIIDEIECDWGVHKVIQCPNCEELFSVDKKCPAFKNIFELIDINEGLYTFEEKNEYLKNSHFC